MNVVVALACAGSLRRNSNPVYCFALMPSSASNAGLFAWTAAHAIVITRAPTHDERRVASTVLGRTDQSFYGSGSR